MYMIASKLPFPLEFLSPSHKMFLNRVVLYALATTKMSYFHNKKVLEFSFTILGIFEKNLST